jgi:single-strand DNA-binding protein
MATDINRVILIGRLTRDIEIKTAGQSQIAKFSLASNRSEKRGDTWSEAAGFFDCVLFGKRAEVLQKYAKKGSKLCVEGSLRWSSWEGSDGKKNSKVEIHVEQFQFLDSKQGEPAPAGNFDGADESIPF